ncbi:hypothetical protein BK824_33075 [Klebsiella pneumoniae]|uniref:Uncharacterized protein n=2 Tax=root TaxID=1 RepID=A0A482MFN7_9CAUD|nr:hypothetical protein HYP83_gp15 [Klebsiella phage ST15-OXA48phi14.1]AOT66272.1 hypothetical protein BH709_19790 [Klebsiella pneumoniae]NGZ00687.1 hypothetical protein [Klebsiella pneumoniae subsp. pneumoniae]APM58097.1 hypothetical protein BB789_06910 [Klebsiella pneumoniae]AZG63920.1 hypothetical protein EHF42_06230 [Klebsiella pneumoniae]EIW8737800.1 hypothetical protein [Klebsiella pneumoniae]
MNLHDRLRIVLAPARQFRRAFSYLMQVHENHYTKRAGVAGIRARATGKPLDLLKYLSYKSNIKPKGGRG